MFSFDIVSLFTKVPVDEAIDIISSRLAQDNTLDERTTMPPGTICQLTKLPQLNILSVQRLFLQLEGAAMGSPLSPVIANVYMEALEERALHSFQLQPKKCGSDMSLTQFFIWPHGREALSDFNTHLNQQTPSIQFTMEGESDGKMPFLDIVIERKGSKATTVVYWKPTLPIDT